MKKIYRSNSRLYITEDRYRENVWFVKTDTDMIARLKLNDCWEIYLYIYKFTLRVKSLKDALMVTEKIFKEFWTKKYGGINAIHNS